ncbi:MAG: ATP-binding cassette domain-containing protein, partial [Chitinivibrionales bacterium]|nr:ATP-binding cassette domain-containing protein [Chitinivibrionales bacterium]
NILLFLQRAQLVTDHFSGRKSTRMALISLSNISVAFGGPRILDGITLQLTKKERVCLIGRNGSGKSTLMRLLAGQINADAGTIAKDSTVTTSYLPQSESLESVSTVYEALASISRADSADEWAEDGTLQTAEKSTPAYHIEKIIMLLGLEGNACINSLSGGQKRRVLLGRALIRAPDLLLLDEPTNHLDIEAITWLEEYLQRYRGALLFVTHDRMLVRRIADRIIEIDRGKVFDWACSYDEFLRRKQEMLEAQQKEWERFDKKMSEEEVWIRRGIKARRTRNEGRVRALMTMRQQRQERREQTGTASFEISSTGQSGKLVAEMKNIHFAYGEKVIISDFSAVIQRGDRIGIIGRNGSGKTTFLKLLLGELSPGSGSVRLGTNISSLYFDQLREQLDDEKTVWENVVPNGDTVVINGCKKHVIGYLQDFLFDPSRARTPVRNLSGGERNRLLLARLFTGASNLLVLDEPTNDLDAETLELLEEVLLTYEGTVILVSHDRAFLNNVVTSLIWLDGNGTVREYVGGYDDWLDQKAREEEAAVNRKKTSNAGKPKSVETVTQRKLTYSQKRELQELPARIELLENELSQIHAELASPEIYKNGDGVKTSTKRMDEVTAELTALYERWQELESIKTQNQA